MRSPPFPVVQREDNPKIGPQLLTSDPACIESQRPHQNLGGLTATMDGLKSEYGHRSSVPEASFGGGAVVHRYNMKHMINDLCKIVCPSSLSNLTIQVAFLNPRLGSSQVGVQAAQCQKLEIGCNSPVAVVGHQNSQGESSGHKGRFQRHSSAT